ncbi:hypothetical protein V3C99_010467 [Haemonchus contortus]
MKRSTPSWDMIRSKESNLLRGGLRSALKILEHTPIYEEGEEPYTKAIQEAERLDVQLHKDHEALLEFVEDMPKGVCFHLDKLLKLYEERCADSNVTGSYADIIAKLRDRRPGTVDSEECDGAMSSNTEGEQEMRVVEVVRKLRDPLGGGQIRDPVKSKDCGHVYDRKTLLEYIRSSRARRAMFYQCPYSLCANKKNMNMDDMIDCPEYLAA